MRPTMKDVSIAKDSRIRANRLQHAMTVILDVSRPTDAPTNFALTFGSHMLNQSKLKLAAMLRASVKTLWPMPLVLNIEAFTEDMHRLRRFVADWTEPREQVDIINGDVGYHLHDMIGTRWKSVKSGDIYLVTDVAILQGPAIWFLGDKVALVLYRKNSAVGPMGPLFARVAWHFAMRFEPVL